MHGFGTAEYEYMRALQAANGRPLGLIKSQRTCGAFPVETIESEIETFLLQEHAVEFTGRRKQLTKAVRDRPCKAASVTPAGYSTQATSQARYSPTTILMLTPSASSIAK